MNKLVDSLRTVNRNFLLSHILLLLVFVSLEIYYNYFISVQFDYLGFKQDFSTLKFFENKLLYLVLVVVSMLTFYKSQFIYAIYVLLILFFFIPNAVMFECSNGIRGPIYSNFCLILIFLSIASFKLKLPTIVIPKKASSSIFIGFALIVLVPIAMVYKLDININTLILKEIYNTRSAFSLKETSMIKYLYNWEVKAIIPLLLVYLLIKGKKVQAFLVFLILIYLFVISGNKIVYMTSIITLFFYYVGNNYSSKIIYFLSGMFLILIILPIIDVFVLHTYLLRGTIVMRTFFFPSLLNVCYFDYFDNVSLYFAENSPFNMFFSSPLSDKSARIISMEYFQNSDMYANNGIVSDGFMNLGYLGVLVLSVLFGFIFLFFNSLHLSSKYFGVFLAFVFLFLSLPTFTVLMTGGVWIFALIAFFILRERTT